MHTTSDTYNVAWTRFCQHAYRILFDFFVFPSHPVDLNSTESKLETMTLAMILSTLIAS